MCDIHSSLLLIFVLSICTTKATPTVALLSNDNAYDSVKRPDEYVMTMAQIDGIKRSNVCGEGYRIEGALLKSYLYTTNQSYLPNENCFMTFKARRPDTQLRIRILSMDINDIHGGTNCLDWLRFYKSVNTSREEKLNTVECGKLTERDKFSTISKTGIVTAHFVTDGGNVNGLGFKVVLTAFRTPNKTHPCESNDEEHLCSDGECISASLLCDGVAHCSDESDESPKRFCIYKSSKSELNDRNIYLTPPKRQHWRGIVIVAFLLIILIVLVFYTINFLCCRCLNPTVTLVNGKRKTYATILHSPKTPTKTTTRVVTQNDKTVKRLDDDYNLV